MHDAPGNHEALLRLQVDRAILEIDDEVPFEDEKELIVAVVLVPVILALHHPEADDRVVDLAESLVVPALPALRHQRRHVDHAERRELDVEMGGVGVVGGLAHVGYSPRLSASFSIFWNTSAGLSPAREYSCRRLISSSAASRSAAVDRKSTRLNSSHVSISYAVFCLKKKIMLTCSVVRHSLLGVDPAGLRVSY